MLKNILSLEGAQQLNKGEQVGISGGGHNCNGWPDGRKCNGLGWVCCGGSCSCDGNCTPLGCQPN